MVSIAFANSNELGKAASLLMQYNANTNLAAVAGAYDTWNLGGFDSQWSNEIFDGGLNNLGILIQKTQTKSPAYAGQSCDEIVWGSATRVRLWEK